MTSSLRAKTAAVRRQHIIEAAGRRFAETGYHRTTIRDVAQEAGVADGTIYNSFASKADLLLGMLDPLAERLPAGSTRASETPSFDPKDIAALLGDRWSALTSEVTDLLRVVLSEALVDRAVGDAFRTRVLAPAIEPLEHACASAGMPDAPLAARAAISAFLGLAVLRMLGDPVIEAAGDGLPERAAAMLGEMTHTPRDS